MYFELAYILKMPNNKVIHRVIVPFSPQQLRTSLRNSGSSSRHQEKIPLSLDTLTLLVSLGF